MPLVDALSLEEGAMWASTPALLVTGENRNFPVQASTCFVSRKSYPRKHIEDDGHPRWATLNALSANIGSMLCFDYEQRPLEG